jgi:hypothetical protein
MSDIQFEAYKKAFRQLTINDAKKGFKGHFVTFIIMNTIFIIINLATNPTTLWCLGSIIGWGVGVLAHYVGGVKLLEKKIVKMENKAATVIAGSD